MTTQDDVARIALSLPDTLEHPDRFAYMVRTRKKPKGFVWAWLERIHPNSARVPSADVIAFRVRDDAEKQRLIASDPAKFFTEPHYDGYLAVLARLPALDLEELEALLLAAWRTQAPPSLVEDYLKRQSGPGIVEPLDRP